MAKKKKIYEYVEVKDRKCYACNGGGRLLGTIICSQCAGRGWHYRSERKLVREEVIK